MDWNKLNLMSAELFVSGSVLQAEISRYVPPPPQRTSTVLLEVLLVTLASVPALNPEEPPLRFHLSNAEG